MKLKNWLAAAAITILPKPAAAEITPENKDSTNQNPIEIKSDTVPSQDIVAAIDSIPSDSTVYETRLRLLRESKKDMLLLIAHFEDVKARAYWDDVAKIYSVGFGFTRKKDGTKVNSRTVIRSEDELMEYWERFSEDNMFPIMAKYLAIEKTDHQERVSLASTAFNCGAGIYKKSKEDAPSKYAETLNAFFETGDSVYLNKAVYTLEQYSKSRGRVIESLKKRRRLEADILAHKIIIVNSDTLTDSIAFPPNAIDLNKTIIGATTSIGRLPIDSAELATKIREFDTCGYNYSDSIKHAFSAPLVPVKRRAKKAVAKPRGAGGRGR